MPLKVDNAVIAILLRLLEQSDHESYLLEAPRPVIHAAFGRVHEQVPQVFPRVNFGKYGSLKNSESIDYVWRGLAMGGMISTENPRLVAHRVKSGLADEHKARIDALVEEQELEDELDRATEVFREAVKDIRDNKLARELIVTR